MHFMLCHMFVMFAKQRHGDKYLGMEIALTFCGSTLSELSCQIPVRVQTLMRGDPRMRKLVEFACPRV